MTIISALLVLVGLLCVIGGWTDGDWLLETAKGKEWSRVFGREKARRFYMYGGTVMIALGVASYLWVF